MNIKNIYLSKAMFLLVFFSFNISANTELVTVKIIEESSSKEIAVNNALMRAVSQVNGFELNAKIDSDFRYSENEDDRSNNKQIGNQANKTQSGNSSDPEKPNEYEYICTGSAVDCRLVDKLADGDQLLVIDPFLEDKNDVTGSSGDKGQGSTSLSENMKKGLAKKSDYKTKGLVKSWKIISESYSSLSDKWTVEVEITIEKNVEFKLSKETERKRIAISPFRTVNPNFSKFFEESLNSYLAQLGKFAIFDRKYTQEQASELKKYEGSGFRRGEVSRTGNMLGVDYIVVGNIAEFKEKSINSIKLKTISNPFTKKKIFVDISYRVIDVATGQIKYSGYIAKDFLKDKNYSIINFSRKIAELIGRKIANSIYPIAVVQVDEDKVVLAQGGDTVSVTDQFNLIQYGQELFDPYTNESLGFSENNIGTIEVVDVQNKLSTAKILMINILKLNVSNNLIARPIHKKTNLRKLSSDISITPKIDMKRLDKDDDW